MSNNRGWLPAIKSREFGWLLFGVLLVWIVFNQPHSPAPRLTRTFSGSSQQAKVLWVREGLFPIITSNLIGIAYALSEDTNNLIAFDIRTGVTIWKADLPTERTSGVRGLLADQSKVFAISTLGIDAFDATTGKLKWSTKLGGGHVRIIGQIEAGVLRDYYGENLFELNPVTGKILSSTSKASTVWIADNINLQALPDDKIQALDLQSGEQLWTNSPAFYIDEGQEPQKSGTDTLIVGRKPGPTDTYANGLCALNTRTGNYNWCRPETYLSKAIIDNQSGKGYVLRSDFVLVTIDPLTGNILGETNFLPSELPTELANYSPGYAVTANAGVVVVSFWDSGQTFGLSFGP